MYKIYIYLSKTESHNPLSIESKIEFILIFNYVLII